MKAGVMAGHSLYTSFCTFVLFFCLLLSCSFSYKRISQVHGVSAVQRLSVIQLNSEEPFVASVTVAISPATAAAGLRERILDATKEALSGHNIGHSTVEIVIEEDADVEWGGRGNAGDTKCHPSTLSGGGSAPAREGSVAAADV